MVMFSPSWRVPVPDKTVCDPNRWRVRVGPMRLLFLLGYLALTHAAGLAESIYVSPSGNDAWTGERPDPAPGGGTGPKKTLEAALQLARRIRKASRSPSTPVAIILRGGVYELPNTLVLTADDSGTAQSPLVIRAQPGEEPILSGGTALSPVSQSKELWTATLPQVFKDEAFTQLYVGGERRQRVRMPKQGYYQVAGSVHPDDPAAPDAFRFYLGDVKASARINEVTVRAFQKWSVYTLQAARCDEVARTLSFGIPGRNRHRIPFDKTFLYVLENVADAPLSEGEWFFDGAGCELRYAPRAGESAANSTFVAPRLETL